MSGTICGGHLCGNHRGDKAKGGLLFLYSKMRRIYMDQRKNYTIKQIMPLPEGYEVMMEVAQQDGTKMMEAAKETLFPYCLVLLEGDNGDRIELYNLFPGCGVEECGESILVPIRYCEKCGSRMTPHMQGTDESTLYYSCRCGCADGCVQKESEEEKANE